MSKAKFSMQHKNTGHLKVKLNKNNFLVLHEFYDNTQQYQTEAQTTCTEFKIFHTEAKKIPTVKSQSNLRTTKAAAGIPQRGSDRSRPSPCRQHHGKTVSSSSL